MSLSLPSKELSIAQTHYSEAVSDKRRWQPSRGTLRAVGADFTLPSPGRDAPLRRATRRHAGAELGPEGSLRRGVLPATG